MLALRIAAGGAEQVVLRAEPSIWLQAARIGESAAPFGEGNGKEPYFLRCAGRSCDGATLVLVFNSREVLRLTVIGILKDTAPLEMVGISSSEATYRHAFPGRFAPTIHYFMAGIRVDPETAATGSCAAGLVPADPDPPPAVTN